MLFFTMASEKPGTGSLLVTYANQGRVVHTD
jgi:hypothetical protein